MKRYIKSGVALLLAVAIALLALPPIRAEAGFGYDIADWIKGAFWDVFSFVDGEGFTYSRGSGAARDPDREFGSGWYDEEVGRFGGSRGSTMVDSSGATIIKVPFYRFESAKFTSETTPYHAVWDNELGFPNDTTLERSFDATASIDGDYVKAIFIGQTSNSFTVPVYRFIPPVKGQYKVISIESDKRVYVHNPSNPTVDVYIPSGGNSIRKIISYPSRGAANNSEYAMALFQNKLGTNSYVSITDTTNMLPIYLSGTRGAFVNLFEIQVPAYLYVVCIPFVDNTFGGGGGFGGRLGNTSFVGSYGEDNVVEIPGLFDEQTKTLTNPVTGEQIVYSDWTR